MEADRLEDLLTRTDAALPPPREGGLLTERVRAKAVRRTRIRLAFAILLPIATAAAVLQSFRSPARPAQRTSVGAPTFDVARLRRELAILDAEAALHQRAATEIAAIQRQADKLQRARTQALLAPAPLAYLDQARDRAARILLIDADRLVLTGARRNQALDDYRRAVELFPGTPAAQEAAQRLRSAGT